MKITRRRLLGTAALAAPALLLARNGFAAGATLKAAIVMPGPITDHGWSQSGYEAMKLAGEKLGIETAYSEKVAQPDHVEILSDYARRGFTHVIGHGGEFQDAIDRVAARFSDTRFIVTNGLHAKDNVSTADFYFSQPAYLLGFLGGRISKTGKVGLIQAQKFKFTNDTLAGFEAGFKAARPDGEVFATWTGDWDDVAKGKEAALNQISQGADIIWPTMDSATQGSLQAVREKGVKAFGLYYDAIAKWPDIMLQSSILDVKALIVSLLTMAKKEGLTGKNYKYDVNQPDVVRLGTFGPDIAPSVVAEVEALVSKIKSGELLIEPV
ncbi:BMP family protein [Mesorhizobium sp. M0013]|uniref:BMP family protein n=1 Tax=Mesorhizobium sp. M0013 TaxID=2956841 RepID=UPI00333D4827